MNTALLKYVKILENGFGYFGGSSTTISKDIVSMMAAVSKIRNTPLLPRIMLLPVMNWTQNLPRFYLLLFATSRQRPLPTPLHLKLATPNSVKATPGVSTTAPIIAIASNIILIVPLNAVLVTSGWRIKMVQLLPLPFSIPTELPLQHTFPILLLFLHQLCPLRLETK